MKEIRGIERNSKHRCKEEARISWNLNTKVVNLLGAWKSVNPPLVTVTLNPPMHGM